jgi:4-hydroxythreonine-4-phosphate dehydrogenase
MPVLPRLLITLGDVAGIGPEVAVRAWSDPLLHAVCRPVIVGDPGQIERALARLAVPGKVLALSGGDRGDGEGLTNGERRTAIDERKTILCLRGSDQDLNGVELGRVSAVAGRAAYDFLCTAIDLTLAGPADGIVTLPLHKEGLRAAGLSYPGHTEILAERTGAKRHAMALHIPPGGQSPGLTVTHVTLHVGLREVFGHLTTEAILAKTIPTRPG